MNKLRALLLGAGLTLPAVLGWSGCAPTMVLTGQDHEKQVGRYMALECRQIVEDADYLLLQDQVSHLTCWNMPFRPR